MLVGYARVSTKEQNYEMQIQALRNAGCEKIFLKRKVEVLMTVGNSKRH